MGIAFYTIFSESTVSGEITADQAANISPVNTTSLEKYPTAKDIDLESQDAILRSKDIIRKSEETVQKSEEYEIPSSNLGANPEEKAEPPPQLNTFVPSEQKSTKKQPANYEQNNIIPINQSTNQSTKQLSDNFDTELNNYILDVVKSYGIAPGKYPYLLNNDYANYNGVTKNILYQGQLLAKAHPSGNRASHCSGLTFEVFFKAMQERNLKLGLSPDDFNGMSGYDLKDLMMIWFVSSGSKWTNNIVIAVEKYGLGRAVTDLENAKPGDFLDFQRESGSGHTAIFLNWIREGDQMIGVRYWSTQSSTNGINYNTEYFNVLDKTGNKYGNLLIEEIRIARVYPSKEYKSFQ